eukprot:2394473-Amphidinium_carterae.2
MPKHFRCATRQDKRKVPPHTPDPNKFPQQFPRLHLQRQTPSDARFLVIYGELSKERNVGVCALGPLGCMIAQNHMILLLTKDNDYSRMKEGMTLRQNSNSNSRMVLPTKRIFTLAKRQTYLRS